MVASVSDEGRLLIDWFEDEFGWVVDDFGSPQDANGVTGSLRTDTPVKMVFGSNLVVLVVDGVGFLWALSTGCRWALAGTCGPRPDGPGWLAGFPRVLASAPHPRSRCRQDWAGRPWSSSASTVWPGRPFATRSDHRTEQVVSWLERWQEPTDARPDDPPTELSSFDPGQVSGLAAWVRLPEALAHTDLDQAHAISLPATGPAGPYRIAVREIEDTVAPAAPAAVPVVDDLDQPAVYFDSIRLI